MVSSISRSPTARQNGSASLIYICTLGPHFLFRELTVEFFVGNFLVGSQAATHDRDDPLDIIIGKQAIGAFGNLQNLCNICGIFLDLVLAQEEAYIMLARQWSNFDIMNASNHAGRHAAVHMFRKPVIILAEGFGDCRGVDACGGAEGIGADDRIIEGNDRAAFLGNHFAILREFGQVAVCPAE